MTCTAWFLRQGHPVQNQINHFLAQNRERPKKATTVTPKQETQTHLTILVEPQTKAHNENPTIAKKSQSPENATTLGVSNNT